MTIRAAGRLGGAAIGRRLLRNVAVLATGTATAQVLTVLAYPVLMRLYSPAEFGLLSLFALAGTAGAVVGGWHYEGAIVTCKGEEEARHLLVLALGLALVTAGVFGLVFWLGRPVLAPLAGPLDPFLPWVPVAVLVFGGSSVLSFWATRQGRFTAISAAQVARAAGTAGPQLAGGFLGLGAGGLVAGALLGQAAYGAVLARLGGLPRLAGTAVSAGTLRALAREHRQFPLYSLPADALNAATAFIPSVMLASLHGPAAAGLFWFAYRLLEMPLSLLGDAVRRVFFQRAAELRRAGQPLLPLFLATVGGLGALALPGGLLVVAAGPWLFGLLFGPDWAEAGQYARWIVAWWLTRFLCLPAIALAPVLGLQRRLLVLEVAALPPRLAAIPVGGWLAGAEGAVAAYAVVGAAFNLACLAGFWPRDAAYRAGPPAPALAAPEAG